LIDIGVCLYDIAELFVPCLDQDYYDCLFDDFFEVDQPKKMKRW